MNNRKSFIDKVTSFIFGEPIPVLGQDDLQEIHSLHHKLDRLINLLDTDQAGLSQRNGPLARPARAEPPSAAPGQEAQPAENLGDLAEQVRKLAKTQFKTNTLQESQLAQQQETLTNLQKALTQQERSLAELAQQREQAVAAAELEVLKSLLPVLDSLDDAFAVGRRQVLQLPMSREVRQAIIGWLDGIRLARMRLLDVLAAHQITPIPTVGQPFDPHRHIAVATDTGGRAPDGVIVGQDRAGYATPTKVLREAEVVVARSG